MKDNLCNKKAVSKVVLSKANSNTSQYIHSKVSKRSSSSKYCKQKPYEISKVSNASLDTLETTSEVKHNVEEEIDFNGSAKNEEKKLRKRARLKHFNNLIAVRLAELRSPLEEAYRDTYYCSERIVVKGDQAKAEFCKRRWCIVCNRIRTAQLLNKYLLTIDSWEEKCFLTLTVKNPKAYQLLDTIKTMHKFFTDIKDSERKAKRKLVGIRKLEITYNGKEDTYHPHFHFILNNSISVDHIILKWLRKFNPHIPSKDIKAIKEQIDINIIQGAKINKYIKLGSELEVIRKTMRADPQFQDWKKADKDSVFELFKYFTKLTSNSSKDKSVSIKALDIIFNSIYKLRTFQPFGFIAHNENIAPEVKKEIEQAVEEIPFDWLEDFANWVNKDTGEALTNYKPTEWDKEKRKLVR